MHAPRLLHRLPAYLINGISVALGVALVQIGVGAFAGFAAAVTAAGGAIYASLADRPIAMHRSWHRVVTAALVGCGAALVIELLRPFPLALGLAAALIGFASAMTLAWGARAGPISFVAILALVFTMAAPPPDSLAVTLARAGWAVLGAAIYVAWAMALAALLQRRYRTLALALALQATARLLRSRGALLVEGADAGRAAPALQAAIRAEATLSARLQEARDLLFAAPETALARRQTALLLLTIDLRDTLLASELDHDLLGHDAAGGRVRGDLAANMHEMADAFDRLHEALRLEQSLHDIDPPLALLDALAADRLYAAADPRARLLASLLVRARHMAGDLAQMRALLQHEAAPQLPLDRAELQLFVSLEGWPLAAFRPHLNLRSPVMRHALRAGIALSSAYFIAEALPWSSHPAWLVLSVAVVLRGDLEQTLTRRNARVVGTALGCLLVLGLVRFGAPWFATLMFLIAVGAAHAFVNVRYLVTAAAAAVMALLQSHLADPASALAVNERLADTVLGALLAWGFSYVLPSWEKRRVAQLGRRVVRSLAALAQHALHLPQGPNAELELRLARREVYDALDAVAATAQRTRVEPARVRVPLVVLAALLMHSHALLAQLAAVKALLQRRRADLDRPVTEAALQAAVLDLQRRLGAADQPLPGQVAPTPDVALPPPAADAFVWLQRRLQIAALDATRVAQAAAALQAVAGIRR